MTRLIFALWLALAVLFGLYAAHVITQTFTAANAVKIEAGI